MGLPSGLPSRETSAPRRGWPRGTAPGCTAWRSNGSRRPRRRRRRGRCWCDGARPPRGLASESLEEAPILRVAGGQDLQRDATAERLLDRLEDDAHTAAADLADDPVVAELAGDRPDPDLRRSVALVRGRLEPLQLDQGGEQLADVLGQLGMRRVYSVRLGLSPRRYRSRNDSASRSTGSRVAADSFMVMARTPRGRRASTGGRPSAS